MARCVRTRTHVKRRSAAEIGAALTTGRQPEVGEVNVLEVVRAEDVLRLQVSVNDAVIVEILQPHETFDLTRGTGQVTHRKRSAQLVSQTFRFMLNYEESVKGRT